MSSAAVDAKCKASRSTSNAMLPSMELTAIPDALLDPAKHLDEVRKDPDAIVLYLSQPIA